MTSEAKVHFDFVVNPEQADIIYEGVQYLILRAHGNIQRAMVALAGDGVDKERKNKLRAEIKWFKKHIKWLEKIPPLMKCKRV
jgi:hypothetical protein